MSCIENVEQIPSNIYLFLIDFHRIDALEWAINHHWCVGKRNRKHTHRSPRVSTQTQRKPTTIRNFIVHFEMIEAVMFQLEWTTKYGWRQRYRPDEKWWNVNSFISMLFYSNAFDSAFTDGQPNLYDANILSTNASFIYLLHHHSNADVSSGFYYETFCKFTFASKWNRWLLYDMILCTLDDYH